mmetsp:Transcript_83744/g.211184  ORF Transcript_83744/g.211184 Transcript_83744/m.211184 type:complete len:410 (-) Transcript_83744:56-1285(-)
MLATVTAFAKRGSNLPRRNSIFFCSPKSQTLSSASAPSMRSVDAFLHSSTSSRTAITPFSASSAVLTMSSEVSSLTFMARALVSVSTLVIFSSTASTCLTTSSTFFASSSFISASFFSLSKRASLRLPSWICSRAMPMSTLSFWKSTLLTPLPPSAMYFMMSSTTSFEMSKLNSPLAYFSISFLLSMPSLSESYFLKSSSTTCTFFSASSFLAARSFDDFANCKVASMAFVVSLMRTKSFDSVSLSSGCGWPGGIESAARISTPFWRMKTVQACIFSLAFTPTSSTAFAVASTSSNFISRAALPCRGSASSRSAFPAFSASSTRTSRDLRCSSARSCSCRICSSLWRACWRPMSASCLITSAWEPQLASSRCKTSRSSFCKSSKVSGLTMRSLRMTRRMFEHAPCSILI